MFADESRPNTREEKHEAILAELNELINLEARRAKFGNDSRDEIFHLQRQINHHKDYLSFEQA